MDDGLKLSIILAIIVGILFFGIAFPTETTSVLGLLFVFFLIIGTIVCAIICLLFFICYPFLIYWEDIKIIFEKLRRKNINAYTIKYGKIKKGIRYSIFSQKTKGLASINLSNNRPPEWRWFNNIKQANVMLIEKGKYKWYELYAPQKDILDDKRIIVRIVTENKLKKWFSPSKRKNESIVLFNLNAKAIDLFLGTVVFLRKGSDCREYDECAYGHGTNRPIIAKIQKDEALIFMNTNSAIRVRGEDDIIVINNDGHLIIKDYSKYKGEQIPISETYL